MISTHTTMPKLHLPAFCTLAPKAAAARKVGVDMPALMRTLTACSTSFTFPLAAISLKMHSRSLSWAAFASLTLPVYPALKHAASSLAWAAHNLSASKAHMAIPVLRKSDTQARGGTTSKIPSRNVSSMAISKLMPARAEKIAPPTWWKTPCKNGFETKRDGSNAPAIQQKSTHKKMLGSRRKANKFALRTPRRRQTVSIKAITNILSCMSWIGHQAV
mmetsp:Transcript_17269/g.43912  ORF Transcript_17269/g.43912 Transcript_17269/m.43912 type:complete len:218 (-) Transcript_17269:260-913(-)